MGDLCYVDYVLIVVLMIVDFGFVDEFVRFEVWYRFFVLVVGCMFIV